MAIGMLKRNFIVPKLLGGLCMVLISCADAGNEVVTIESLIEEMVDRDAVARFPEKGFRLKQESSYNRASTSPKDTVGWFTNHDFNAKEEDRNFIRVEENAGQKEWVLMDHKGPGALVRTWMPFLNPDNPDTNSRIKIYLDGANEPVIEGNALGLLNGTGLFPFPFAHKSLRSAVSFFPIPYAESCKITVTERPFFYQLTYRTYEEGTAVKTFTQEDYRGAKELIARVGERLLDPQVPANGEGAQLKGTLGANEEKSVALPRELRHFAIFHFAWEAMPIPP